MFAASGANATNVIKFVQTLLIDDDTISAVTPAIISEKIDMVLMLNSKWAIDLDREAVIDELIRRFSLWVGQDTTLQDNVGHVNWLDAARKKDWRYWQRYRELMEQKLSDKAIDGLDRATDHILGLLEDPAREGIWDRRGLVVGHVQSGKTGNYTGLICKAADAGYKIIIVLAGLHNNLRSQTQMRLDEGFLGYETSPSHDEVRPIGVGLIDSDPAIRPNFATNRSNSGDFNAAAAKNLGISPEQRPWLFVVKKNKSVLERLNRWIRNRVADSEDPETGRRIVSNLPLLLIDDEADHASVDTGAQSYDPDGKPDEEYEPKAINRLVRRILHSFSRSAYVGYTATPFANIFIHEQGSTRDEGPDLFPASFIINLGAPSNYIGPAKVFGNAHADSDGLPLVHAVDDYYEDDTHGWMPPRHKAGHQPKFNDEDRLPPSLVRAIQSFFIACAVRRLRGQGGEHASMLIHVTRLNAIQQAVTRQVEEYVRQSRQRLTRNVDSADLLRELEELWIADFEPSSERIRNQYPNEAGNLAEKWADVRAHLADAVTDIEVRMINGTAKDALDYSDNGTGLKVIAIGGDKLARGLTLEGLSTSYFLRASRMYDTLMQMGRWFGYRPGYLDLCRLYTTHDLIEWFQHISEAAEELREEFDLMAASGGTPRDYGLKVQSHSTLMVTSQMKMRSARSLMLSFSGQLLETVVFHRDKELLEANLSAGESFLSSLGDPAEVNPQRTRGGRTQEWTGYLWRDVEPSAVVGFLQSYSTHRGAHRVVSPVIAEFVDKMAAAGELTNWTIAVVGAAGGSPHAVGKKLTPSMLKRTVNVDLEDRYSIGRLLSPRDEALDLSEPEWDAALALTREAWAKDPARLQQNAEPEAPNGPAIRQIAGFGRGEIVGHPQRGLLMLYYIDPEKSKVPDSPAILAFGISFPGSNAGPKIEYKVDNVYWQQVYGDAD
ncbi:Z1 domain-containing protein [Sphingomonas carotinifaciens]|uniref:Z1 domain-containing protein n=1 Tax=Sphingomonas carotinifaciens TaxID=1166323 RepID=UPI0039A13231